jgi:cytochrome bd-type quinol oxidase subunit 2
MEEQQDLFDIKVTGEAERELNETSRWSKLMGILIFTICGIALLFLLLAGGKISEGMSAEMPGENSGAMLVGILVAVVIMIAIVSVIMYFLLRAANRIKAGLQQKNQAMFNGGLNDMKIYFTIYGIFSILGLLLNLTSLF